jgi:DNA-binding NtrC family response regulator
MKCSYFDPRSEFFAILNEKLGDEFELLPALSPDPDKLSACDVAIVSLPTSDHPQYTARLAMLEAASRNRAGVPVVAFIPVPERELTRSVMLTGAYDAFAETQSMEELRIVLRRASQFHEMNRELRRLRATSLELSDFVSIVGCDSKMRAIYTFASKVAATDATVLVTGETGTGKELLARAIHKASPRSQAPFIAVSCSSLPETLIEAELFGHERGAFTGANTARKGRFEAAEQGTIFLDEIGELSPGLQVKLLRVLQERTFERLGSNQPRQMEARVICATNRNLKELVKAGLFRADLYYRLNTIELALPPLCERRDDVAVLAYSFLQTYAEKHRSRAHRIAAGAMHALEEYAWPGNIRELQNVIERAVVICDGPEIRMEHLPLYLADTQEPELETPSFDDEVKSFKRRLIYRVLSDNGNNKLQAARSLKIARSSLHRLIDELEIASPEHSRVD